APTTKPTTAPTTTGRKVFAHYFPPYPISIDNKDASADYYARNYLTVDGESGKHAAYGGLLRDRPVPRAAQSSSDWKVRDLETEVRPAEAAGIDGFTLNLMSTSGLNWTASVNLMEAAERVGGFTVVPNVDPAASIGSQEPSLVASKL